MKHLKWLLYFSLLVGPCIWGTEQSPTDNIGIADIIGTGVVQVTDIRGTAILNQRKNQRKLKVGDSFFETTYLETKAKSFVTLILPDNSMVYLGPKTVIKIHEIAAKVKDSKINFDLIKGVMRMISYKGEHLVSSPNGTLAFSAADLEWDVYQTADKVVTDIKKFSGKIINQGEVIQVLSSNERPEVNNLGIDSFNQPWERWLGKIDRSHDYALAYYPRFDSSFKGPVKGMGRGIASIETSEENLDSDFSLMSGAEEKVYSYPKVTPKIYVHENFFDHVLIHVQKAAQVKAKEIVRKTYEAAAKEMVWEVASRSLIRWGTQYAQRAALNEIPTNLKGMYREIENRDIDFRKTKIYVDSVERIAQFKSYLTAKNTVKNTGARKAIAETQTYLMELTPVVITPPVQYEVYKYAKKISTIEANKFLKKSDLVKSEDVDDLIEYLSQVAAKKFTKQEIESVSKNVSYRVAVTSVVEASQRGADKIASFIADKVSKRTAQLFNKMLDQEIAHRAARSLASENQTQLGADYEERKKVQSND